MNELARATLVQNGLDTSVAEKPVRTAPRSASAKGPDVTEWPQNKTGVHGDLKGLSPFGLLPSPSHQTKTDEAPKRFSGPANLPAAPARASRIAIKTKGRILLMNPADLLSVEAEGNYVVLRLRSGAYSLREAISSLVEKLKDYGFVRIHRSVIVNSAWVEEIFPRPTGEYTLRIAGGKEYVVSRTYKTNLKWLAQSWIGTDSFVDE